MLRRLKHLALSVLQSAGAFRVASATNWRRQRLLILCYHGIALDDEDRWCPGLFVPAELFRLRMESLARERCSVVPLADGVHRLYAGTLPPKSVAITFDDGFHDFHELAFPVLRGHGYPATVYQTTYYTEQRFPVFTLMLDYLFWKAGGGTLDGRPFGMGETYDLSRRAETVAAFDRFGFERNLNAAEKDALAARVAQRLGIDYEALRRRRILQLMSSAQLAEISQAGIELELHTHRHRTPVDEALFVREIRDNRDAIRRSIGRSASHFCYPSGVYRAEFLPWLASQGVISATTCDLGIASPASNRLLLPRLLDTEGVSQRDFEGWLAGVSAWLPHRASVHSGEPAGS